MRFLFLLFVSLNCLAQYGDAYHSADNYRLEQMRQERMQANDNSHYANINSSAFNSSSSNSYSSSNNSFVPFKTYWQIKEEEYKKKVADDIAKMEAEQDSIMKLYDAKSDADKNEEQKFVKNFYYSLNKRGVASSDCEVLGGYVFRRFTDNDGYRNEKLTIEKRIVEFLPYLEDFNKSFEIDKFELSLSKIYLFKSLITTAFQSCLKLKGKFPEKQNEIDLFIINEIMPSFFNPFWMSSYVAYQSEYEYGKFGCTLCLKEGVKQRKELEEYIFQLEKKYPLQFKNAVGNISEEYSPYIILANEALVDKNKQLVCSYYLKQLSCPTKPYHYYNQSFKNYVYDMDKILSYLKKNSNELDKMEYEDYKYIAQLKGLTFIESLQLFGLYASFDGETNLAVYNKFENNCRDKIFCKSCNSDDSKGIHYSKSKLNSKSKELIKKAMQEGEPSALNVYGMIVAAGETNEEPIKALDYFNASYEKGNPYAVGNLMLAKTWKLKGYNDQNFEDAKAKYYAYKTEVYKDNDDFKYVKMFIHNVFNNHRIEY